MKKTPLLLHQMVSPISEITEAGFINVKKAMEPMEMEIHDEEYEILYLCAGEKWMTVGEKDYKMCGGDVLLIHPGEVHGKLDSVQNRSSMYYLLLKDPSCTSGFLNMKPAEREYFAKKLSQMRIFRIGKVMKWLMGEIMAVLAQKNVCCEMRLRALLTLLLHELIKEHATNTKNDVSADIDRVLSYIHETTGEMPGVNQLADLAGLSEAHFKQKFKYITGIPPAEYVRRYHIALAKIQLEKSNLKITEIAMRLGFSSGQHLTQMFRDYTGMPPSKYRKQRREG